MGGKHDLYTSYGITLTILFARYDYDGIFEPTPGCRRAVMHAVKALQSRGFKVIPFKPTDLDIALDLNSKFKSSDCGSTGRTQLSLGPKCKTSLGIQLWQWLWPNWMRFIVGSGFYYSKSKILGKMLLDQPGSFSSAEIWSLKVEKLKLLRQILSEWDMAGVDVILAPGFGYPAPKIGFAPWIQAGASYTRVYNLLNFPVGTLKVSYFS